MNKIEAIYELELNRLYQDLPRDIQDMFRVYGMDDCLYQSLHPIRSASGGVAYGYHIYYLISPRYFDMNTKFYRFAVELNLYLIKPEEFQRLFYVSIIRFLYLVGTAQAVSVDMNGGDLGRAADNYLNRRVID